MFFHYPASGSQSYKMRSICWSSYVYNHYHFGKWSLQPFYTSIQVLGSTSPEQHCHTLHNHFRRAFACFATVCENHELFFWVLIMFTAEKSVLIWSNVKWQSTAAVCANLCCKLLCVIQIPFIYLLVVVTNLYWLSYVNLSIRTYSLVILRTELVWNII